MDRKDNVANVVRKMASWWLLWLTVIYVGLALLGAFDNLTPIGGA